VVGRTEQGDEELHRDGVSSAATAKVPVTKRRVLIRLRLHVVMSRAFAATTTPSSRQSSNGT
jgi:hypothetical protein